MTPRLKLVIILAGLGLVIIISLTAILKRGKFQGASKDDSQAAATLSAEQAKLQSERAELNSQLEAISAWDQDLDGLSDQEENETGTNPVAADSDGDGLLDGDEVKVYRTNPVKADTDGNGVSDREDLLRKRGKPSLAK